MTQIESHGWPCSRTARHQLASCLERPHTLIPGCSAHVLNHDVYALFVRNLANFFGYLLLVVVDAVVGAQSAPFLEFCFVASGCDHAAMKQLRNLDGGNRSEERRVGKE